MLYEEMISYCLICMLKFALVYLWKEILIFIALKKINESTPSAKARALKGNFSIRGNVNAQKIFIHLDFFHRWLLNFFEHNFEMVKQFKKPSFSFFR